MDELVKMIISKTGISETQARQAVDIVAKFLKDQLPAPIAGQVDAALKGNLSDLAGGLGNLFK